MRVLSTLCLLMALTVQQLAGQEAPLEVGDRAPRVLVHDLDGKSVDLARYIGVKPVFLEFWATWCESCQELLPRIQAARQSYGSRVEFIGINVAVNQTPDGVREYLKKHDPAFRTLYDDEGNSTRAYQAPATSYIVIIDRSGKVAYTGIGAAQSFEPVLRAVSN
jgi:thiol-disulfide isomerase/thioredoxin